MVLRNLEGMEQPSLLLLHHHERFGGGGYPGDLVGEDIPLGARIIAVADTYDALTTDRPYRRGCSHEDALAEIRRHIKTQFDPAIVDAFLQACAAGFRAPSVAQR
jgi:HD-GYP domain-containing protein (c-di-GMP phosphodiesterase class II)